MPIRALKTFLKTESAGGILLTLAAILGLWAANSSFLPLYQGFLDYPLHLSLNGFELHKPLILWINDGLMAIFFFLIGLEMKREAFEGALSSRRQAALPFIGAIGGIVLPALIYLGFTHEGSLYQNGWAIPTATDIAFALGILTLLGNRVPMNLKILLTAIAVIDDLAAVLIIALFYTTSIKAVFLYCAIWCFIAMLFCNRLGVRSMAIYILLSILLWVLVLKSGVHATIAGVLAALTIPMHHPKDQRSPLKNLEHALHPWVAFAIIPLFGFANAGVPLAENFAAETLLSPLSLGIILGLFLGKQIGVFSFLWLGKKFNLAEMPNDLSARHLYGMACLCGIGFTMSLFITNLAFFDPTLIDKARISIIIGSVLSALMGYLLLASGRKID